MSVTRITYSLLILLISICSLNLHAQEEIKPEVSSEANTVQQAPEDVKSKIKEAKKLMRQIDKGDIYFARGPLYYQLALEIYTDAATKKHLKRTQ